MELSGVLLDLYGRIPPLVRDAVDGLDVEQLVQQPAPGANTIAWLAWHIARVQDHHVAEIIGTEQIWSTGTWAESFHLARDPSNTGYGHSVDDALTVRPETPGAVTSYLDAVAARTSEMLERLSPLGPARDPGRQAHQHRGRRPAARGAGSVRAGHPSHLRLPRLEHLRRASVC